MREGQVKYGEGGGRRENVEGRVDLKDEEEKERMMASSRSKICRKKEKNLKTTKMRKNKRNTIMRR